MCENLKYWMKLRSAKIGLIVIVASFLFFKSTGKSPALADSDHDGLIEIKNATMLHNMRYNLTGTSYKTSARDAGDSSGCPRNRCNGYELSADIDLLKLLDKNKNGRIDTTTVGIDKNADKDTKDAGEKVSVIDTGRGKDTSWVPIGDNSTRDDKNRFTGIFEGNNHTIANLWVNIVSSSGGVYAGLFGMTGGKVTIRNVGVISGSIHSSVHSNDKSADSISGGLVGSAGDNVTITNSYFSGSGGVSSFFFSSSSTGKYSSSGGLVGYGDVTIMNSYFSGSGGVSSSSSSGPSSYSSSSSGGLVGKGGTVSITKCYFSGVGGVSSSSSSDDSSSGGLVGRLSYYSTLSITNSYFSGSGGVSSSSYYGSFYSGGLVGRLIGKKVILTIAHSYWNTDAPQSVKGTPQNPKRAQGDSETNPAGAKGLTLAQLKATRGTYPAGLPNGTSSRKAWNLGTRRQLPAVKTCVKPTVKVKVVTCASYGSLLPGQR